MRVRASGRNADSSPQDDGSSESDQNSQNGYRPSHKRGSGQQLPKAPLRILFLRTSDRFLQPRKLASKVCLQVRKISLQMCNVGLVFCLLGLHAFLQ